MDFVNDIELNSEDVNLSPEKEIPSHDIKAYQVELSSSDQELVSSQLPTEPDRRIVENISPKVTDSFIQVESASAENIDPMLEDKPEGPPNFELEIIKEVAKQRTGDDMAEVDGTFTPQ